MVQAYIDEWGVGDGPRECGGANRRPPLNSPRTVTASGYQQARTQSSVVSKHCVRSAATTVNYPRGPASQSLMMVLVDKWRCQYLAGWRSGTSRQALEGARHACCADDNTKPGSPSLLPQFGTVEELCARKDVLISRCLSKHYKDHVCSLSKFHQSRSPIISLPAVLCSV
jgi:hypothetical protein